MVIEFVLTPLYCLYNYREEFRKETSELVEALKTQQAVRITFLIFFFIIIK